MASASPPGRLEQLVAVYGLAVADRVRDGTEAASGLEGSGSAALVHLQAYPGGSIGDLQRVVGLTQTGAGRLVDRLVDGGLAERRPGRDARTQALWLTGAGEAAADALLQRRRQSMTPLLEPLSPAERRELEELLERLVAGLAADRAGALTVCRLCDRAACCAGPGCPLEHTTSGAEP